MKDKKKSKKPAVGIARQQPIAQSAKIPAGYANLLKDLKSRIDSAQTRAGLAVNRELIGLYWHVGKSIVERQHAEGWGKAVVERLAADLSRAFPAISGFSSANIWRMRTFHLAWTEDILAQPARDSEDDSNLAQPVRDLDGRNMPQPVAEIPWGHNITLIEKLKNPVERLWYVQQTIANGWSRSMLIHWIESGLYTRQGKAVTNFKTTLPPPQSELAAEIIRDPYNLDFLTLRVNAAERELERGLMEHIRKFLLELGAGFAFAGQQVHLEVDGEDFYIDLLFYHLRLRCYVVIDLKVRPFKPEYAGKMNFYLSAVDDQLRHPDDKPSIGIILCKSHNKIIAEYALRDLTKPVGVARYITKLVESLPDNLKDSLPTIQQIEAELAHPPKPCRGKRKKD